MVFCENNGFRLLKGLLNACFLMLMVVGLSGGVTAKEIKTFDSPEAAVEALFKGVKKGDSRVLISFFGPDAKDLISSGDDVADRLDRERVLKLFEEHHGLKEKDPGLVLILGYEKWPFPIPLVKQGNRWRFDVLAGKEEILDRRIGQNELSVYNVMSTYVEAQNEYAVKDLDGNGVHGFASRLRSEPGTKNGLYWPAKEGETMSPMGPLVAQAVRQGYTQKDDNKTPYHGYYYKILLGQGPHANGGAYDYRVHGKMILGHGLLAYPARYGISGIMTFMVNQQGVVYEKDLGQDTASLSAAITKFDPDKSWHETDMLGVSEPKN